MFSKLVFSSIFSLVILAGCGRTVPTLTPSGEDQLFVTDVHVAIRCELIAAVHDARLQAEVIRNFRLENEPGAKQNKDLRTKNFFDDWGLRYTLTLQVVENSGASAALSATSNPVPTPGSTVATIGLGFGGTAKATRTETDQSFSSVQRYAAQKKCSGETNNKIVPDGGALGIGSWIGTRLSLVESGVIGPLNENEAFTYKVQFDLAKSASVGPRWAFVQRNISSVETPFSAGRSTAHSVLVTFGPTENERENLSQAAADVHNAILSDIVDP